MTRTLSLGVSLAAIALLAACGRDEAGDARATTPDGADGVRIVESDPEATPAEAAPATAADGETQVAALDPQQAAPAQAAADRPLTQDLGDDNVTVTVTVSPEVAADAALYDRLMGEAVAEAEEAKQVAAEDAEFRAGEDFPFMPHELQIDWQTTFQNADVLSLLKTTFVFQGGAHPNTYYDSLNWRRDAEAPFGVVELIGDDAGWQALSVAAQDAIMAEKRERLGDGLGDEAYQKDDVVYATAPAPENFELFTLARSSAGADKAGGLTLYYAPYALGPYVEGAYAIVIPQAVFADYVAPDYAGLFAGDPRD